MIKWKISLWLQDLVRFGVNDFSSDDDDSFKPSNGQINVRISKYFGKVDIQVIDITGRKFSTLKRKNSTVKSIDLSRLKAGIYILKISEIL
jgi:hypothetical protein